MTAWNTDIRMLSAFNSFVSIILLHKSLKWNSKTQHREAVSFGNKKTILCLAKMMTIQPFPNAQMKTNPKLRQLGNSLTSNKS